MINSWTGREVEEWHRQAKRRETLVVFLRFGWWCALVGFGYVVGCVIGVG